jgi:adenylate kinase
VSFKAIYFDIDTNILLDRIIYRQSCPVCGEIYNKKFKPSQVEDVCDRCKVKLKTRDDDNAEIAQKRFETYFSQTAPLIEFYDKKGVLYKIDAQGSIEEVWQRLLEIVNK